MLSCSSPTDDTVPLREQTAETKAWKVGCQEKTPGSCATCSAGRVAVRRDGGFGAAEPRHTGTPRTSSPLQAFCSENWRSLSRMRAVGASAALGGFSQRGAPTRLPCLWRARKPARTAFGAGPLPAGAERCFAAAPSPQQPAGWCSGAGRRVQPVPPSLSAGALRGAMSAALSLLISLRSLLHFIVSDKQPSPEDMSERC